MHPSPRNELLLFNASIWIVMPGLCAALYGSSSGGTEFHAFLQMFAGLCSFWLWKNFETNSYRIYLDRVVATCVILDTLKVAAQYSDFLFTVALVLLGLVFYSFSLVAERKEDYDLELIVHALFRSFVGFGLVNAHFLAPRNLKILEKMNVLSTVGLVSLIHIIGCLLFSWSVRRGKKKENKPVYFIIGLISSFIYVLFAVVQEFPGIGENPFGSGLLSYALYHSKIIDFGNVASFFPLAAAYLTCMISIGFQFK